jgi:carbamoyltransferase
MYILGLNAYHGDSSACILRDGEIIAASEEERFRRIKHWAGFPSEAIKFCLADAGISIEQVDYITISRDPRANLKEKMLYALNNPAGFKIYITRFLNLNKVKGIEAEFQKHFGIEKDALKDKVINVEHHHSHMASAFFASPFKNSAILSIDGFGDYSSTMIGAGKDNQIELLDKVVYPHSCGVFYTAFTQFLGFPYYGDEYKVMGLAPYGKPIYMDKVRDTIILKDNGLFELNILYFNHVKKGVSMSWDNGAPNIDTLYSKKFCDTFGTPREKSEELTQYHKDLAASVQKMCEEVIFHILNHLQKVTGNENICIAGGVAQNSVANGKIKQFTKFKNVYIPFAGHDAGTSIGSALYLYNHIKNQPRIKPIFQAYTGIKFTNEKIESLLKKKEIDFIRYNTQEELINKISDSLAMGSVIGWFQGRAEFGPRALGNRSILVDPSRPDAKNLLNSKIKRRESFRPFAPSILEEYVSDFFIYTDRAPFMEKVFPIKEEKRMTIPAVTHVDGTGRLQTVSREDNPKYYDLIDAFRKKTGVPLLLNTSFNENEPIVNTPEEALDCYLRTQMDILVMEDIVIERDKR